jgi:hypothetical protein
VAVPELPSAAVACASVAQVVVELVEPEAFVVELLDDALVSFVEDEDDFEPELDEHPASAIAPTTSAPTPARVQGRSDAFVCFMAGLATRPARADRGPPTERAQAPV